MGDYQSTAFKQYLIDRNKMTPPLVHFIIPVLKEAEQHLNSGRGAKKRPQKLARKVPEYSLQYRKVRIGPPRARELLLGRSEYSISAAFKGLQQVLHDLAEVPVRLFVQPLENLEQFGGAD
jgi:hypothetical protein